MPGSRSQRSRWLIALLAVAILAAAIAFTTSRGSRRASDTSNISLETVTRRDLSQSVEASGTVEPVQVVEIKSKASGEVRSMPVEVGSVVKAGDLLALVEPDIAKNAHDEAAAALAAAEASAQVAATAKARSDELFSQKLIAAEAHETATLALANARATLVRAQSALHDAAQALSDTRVRAPIAGTVLSRTVTQGQVSRSATASTTGGTTLLRMADLSRVQMRAYVSESDIGLVHAGQTARVQVDAHSDRTFRGTVLKVEPEAVVQQSVTLFAVIISLDNREGLLLPGMSGEVVIAIAERAAVLTVPIDAVRSVREARTLAATMGIEITSPAAARPDSAASTGVRSRPSEAGGRPGAGGGGARGGARGGAAASGRVAQVVFLQTPSGLEMRPVTLGAHNYDYYEVVDGLAEGDQVALLGVLQATADRASDQARVRQRMSGVTGGPTSGTRSGASSGSRSGASGGGR